MGTALAGAEPLSESSAVDPTTTTAVPSLTAPACANGLDDDGDGLVDDEDPDCESPEDTNEAPAPAPAPQQEEATPIPAPAPAPSPAPDGGKGSGPEEGTEIDGGTPGGNGGVDRNDTLGDA
ncbi:MAG TPA: hypothetical protein VNM41_02085, partial [Solirubrobacterales bacterium]|nr:hypothetical protein [Solirubrobacterales bacterium]